MQRGQIYKKNGSWLLRYWDIQVNSKVRKVVKLARISPEYPTKTSVLQLAEKILGPLNSKSLQPESSMSVADFIQNYYLPHVKAELRPSTYTDYKTVFNTYLKDRIHDTRLRDFRTVHAQKLLREIPRIGHTSLLRIKSFLSGCFKHARRIGFLDTPNPIVDVSVPGRPKKFKGETYTMEEILEIIDVVGKRDRQAAVVITVAAFAGLRSSELRGLRWSDYDGQNLHIRRSVWRTHVGPTKTEDSYGTVPVLPVLKKVLDEHQIRARGGPDAYMFVGERLGRPVNLANLVRRGIIPWLDEESRKRADEAQAENPDFQVLTKYIKFTGFHAFRRSLATNLYSCGVNPKVIQAILRHSDIGTTLQYYVGVPDNEAREALQKIEDWSSAV
jgi:integrase